MTLADEDTNSIPTDNANRAIIDNVAMQVAPPGGQTCSYMQAAPPGGQTWNQCKGHYMLAKFGTNTSGTTCWSNLELMQVVFLVGEIYQVIESIPWVRCASGNVLSQSLLFQTKDPSNI